MDGRRERAAIYRSKRWKRVRLEAKRRDGWKCIECGSRLGLEVDHITPIQRYPAGSYELANLQTLCKSCHSKKTTRESGHEVNPARERWIQAVKQTPRGTENAVIKTDRKAPV